MRQFYLTILSLLLLSNATLRAQNITGVINTYWPVTAVGTNTVTIDNANIYGAPVSLDCGDRVLIIQMQGATLNTTNTAASGDITAIGTAGVYEFANVQSVVGNVVTLQNNLTRTYNTSGSVQLVYVPVYDSPTIVPNPGLSAIRVTEGGFGYTTPPAVTIAGIGGATATAVLRNGSVSHIIVNNPGSYSMVGAPPNITIAAPTTAPFNIGPFTAKAVANRGLTCLQWNGSCGGILVFEAQGVVTLQSLTGAALNPIPNGLIDVQGMGFMGGVIGAEATTFSLCGTDAFNIDISSYTAAAGKGESLMPLPTTMYRGKGKWGTGGGGGINAEGGGGGGANYGAGGIGGKTSGTGGFTHACTNNSSRRGLAGLGLGATQYGNSVNRIFLGGGGGGGAASNSSLIGAASRPGGAGGGIVIIKSPILVGNSHTINAKGHSVAMGDADGNGGGGGGGVVLFDVPTVTSAVTLNVNGGNGGSTFRNNSIIPYGPGGGGGGGVVWFSSSSTPVNVTTNVAQGESGYATNVSPTEQHGATAGAVGATLYNLVMPGPSTVTLPPAPAIADASNILCAAFTANWGAATGADGYLLDVSTSGTFATFLPGYQNLDVGNVTSYNVTGLTNGTTYYYRVRSYRACSPAPGRSNYSGSDTVVTSTIAPPTGITGIAGCDRVVLTWTAAAGASSYVVDGTTVASNFATYLTGWQNTDIGNVTSVTITGLTGGTAYRFRVRAVYPACNPTQSANLLLSTITPPTSPAVNAIRRWDGEGDGISWTDPLNWDCDVVPVSTQSVTLDNTFKAGSYNVTMPNTAVTLTQMVISPAAGNNIVCTLPSTNSAATAFTLSTNTVNTGLRILTGGKFINAYNPTVGTDRSIVFTGVNGRLRLEGSGHYVHAGRSFDALILARTQSATGIAGTFEYDIPNIPVAGSGVYTGLRVWPIGSTNTTSPITLPNLVFSNTGNAGNDVAYLITNDGTTGAATTNFATTINNNLTINPGAFFGAVLTGAAATKAVTFKGNVINNGAVDPLGTNSIGFGASNPLIFSGTSLQSISGQAFRFFGSMTLNNANGLTTDTEIGLLNGGTPATQASLALTNGVLSTTGTGKVVVYTPQQKITRIAGHIDGTIRQYVQANTTYTYHLGTNNPTTGYRQMDFVIGATLSGLTHVEGRFVNTPSVNVGPSWPAINGQYLSNAGANGYWTMEPDNAGYSISYELRLYLANMGAFTDNEFTVVSRPTGTTGKTDWVGGGTISNIGGTGRLVAGGFASRYGLTSFSEKAIGTSTSGNPFPVEVVNFDGKLTEVNSVALSWTTLMERSADFFVVERSTNNLLSFSPISTVKAKGNSNSPVDYLTYDANPVLGTQIYRLKQVDFDGTVSYHGLIEVTLDSWNDSKIPAYLRLYPNPAIANHNLIVEFRIPTEALADVLLVNTLGQTVWSGKHPVDGSLTRIEIPTQDLAEGIYTVRVVADNTEIASKVIVTD